MERTGADVDAFLAGLPDAQRDDMIALDTLIRRHLDSRERELWQGVFWGGTEQSIIGYARVEQPRPKAPPVEWFLVGLAAQQKHLSLYINAASAGGYLIKQYAGRLGKVKLGAAAITITRLADVDLEGLDSLLAEAFATLDAG